MISIFLFVDIYTAALIDGRIKDTLGVTTTGICDASNIERDGLYFIVKNLSLLKRVSSLSM